MLDNLQMHKSPLAMYSFEDKHVNVLFTPRYCPKLHFKEYIFNIIKRKFNKN